MGLFDDLKDVVVGGARAVGGGIADIAAGPGIPGGDPNLGRRQALQQAGLAMLASDSQDPLQAFAQAAQQSQAYRMEYQQMQIQHQQQQEFAKLASEVGYDRDGVAQLYFKALADGNIPMAKTLSEVMKSMPSPVLPKWKTITDDQYNEETGKTEAVMLTFNENDPNGEIIRRVTGEAPPNTMFERTITVDDPNDPRYQTTYGIVRGTGERVPIGSELKPEGGGRGGGAMSDAMIQVMEDANNALTLEHDQALAHPVQGLAAEYGGRPGVFGAAARGVTNDLTQEAYTISMQFLNPTVRFLSGAQMNQGEAERYWAAFITRANDSDSVIAAKRAGRQALLDAARAGQTPQSRDEAMAFLARQGLTMPAGIPEGFDEGEIQRRLQSARGGAGGVSFDDLEGR